MGGRVGTYAFRTIRYGAVLDKLMLMGFSTYDSVMDIGAGRQEFGKFLREQGWEGRYLPIDGSIDGTDLDTWEPGHFLNWLVAIEVIEHLHDPQRMLWNMRQYALGGIVVTTPNPETTDVLGMDRTHVCEVWPHELAAAGLEWERATLFASPEWRKENDSLVGWRKR